MKYLLFLVILASLVACSKPGHSPAKLKVSFGAIEAGGVPINKILITGQNGTQRFARVLIGGADTVDIELPNGTWNFLAMSWDDNSAGLEGKIRCGGASVALAGAPTAVGLSITNANCFSTTLPGKVDSLVAGTPVAGADAFPTTQTYACRNAAGLDNDTGVCSFGSSLVDPRQAIIGSFRVGLRGVTRLATGTSTAGEGWLGTGCLSPNSPAVLRLPLLGPRFFVPVTVEAFNSTDCTPGKGELVASIDNGQLRVDQTFTGMLPRLFATFPDERVCAARQAAGGTMRIDDIGLGSSSHPFALCNLAQLKHWQENYNSHTNAHVALLSDLNLLPWLKAGSLGLTPYTTSSCFEDGSTFVPLGHSAATCAPLSSPFTGSLHGLGRKIFYFRYDSKEDDVGLFSKLATGASVTGLKLEHVQVRGNSRVGALVGDMGSGVAVQFIEANKIDVEGEGFVGGLVGVSTGSTLLSDLKVTGQVECENGYCGGVVGSADTVTTTRASFIGRVIGSSTVVGGIAGEGRVDAAYASALVTGRSVVGGISGTSANVTHARFDGAVHAYDFDYTTAGGIVGTASLVTDSIFSGSLSSDCQSNCSVGAIAGSAGTVTASYALQDYSDGGNAGTPITSVRSSTTALNANFCGSPSWACAAGGIDTPRLAFEGNHPCGLSANAASVSAQIVAGRGTATNPITICHRDQMIEIDSSPTTRSRVYSLLQNVYAGDTPITTGANPFLGQFRGNGNAIVGFGGASSSNLIRQLGTSVNRSARVENLNVYGMRLLTGTNDVAMVGTNYGTLIDLRVVNAKVLGKDRVAPLVANNYGILNRIFVDANIEGQKQVGGAVALNLNEGTQRGLISEVRAYTRFYPYDDSTYPTVTLDLGGIAGLNFGNIQRSTAEGEWRLHHANWSWDVSRAGGLVGFHQSGSITDSAVSDRFKFYIDQPTNEFIGGLIGEVGGVQGTLARLVSNTFVAFPSGATPTATSARIGYSPAAIPASLIATKGAGREIETHPLVNFTYSANTCTSDPLSPAIITGPQDYMVWLEATREYVLGHYSSVDFSFVTEDSSSCPADSDLRFHLVESSPNAPGIAAMRSTLGFNLVDFENGTTSDKDRAFRVYLNYLQGLAPPSDAPVWIFEDDEFRPFRVDD